MRLPASCAIVALAVLALPGCGTFFNLKDSPTGPGFCGTGVCYPFGGVVRSGLLACAGPPLGLSAIIGGDIALCQGHFTDGFEQIGQGIWLASAGLGAIADTPLSLVGDILTWPIAYARSHEHPWATWWGAESLGTMKLIPLPDEQEKESPANSDQSD